MNEIQKSLLNLLCEIDYICRKYDIEYYLGGGTLIGAVRHGGFLPWDDDADIHMSRENAEKFIDAVEREGLQYRTVNTGREDETYGYAHWRYYNTNSTTLLRSSVGTECQQGQFIDIFINYPLPYNVEKAERCLEYCELYVELKAKNYTISSISNRTPSFFRQYYIAKFFERIIGKKNVLKYLENRMFHFSESESDDWFIRAPAPPKRFMPKAWWGTPRRVKFESIELPVAQYAEVLLCYEYGPTWFEVPQHVDREEHVFVTDFDLPYTKYIEEYNKYLNIRGFYRYEVKKKEFWFSLLKDRNVVNPHIHQLHGKQIVMEIQRNIEQNGIDLLKMLQQGRKEEIANIFSPYFEFIASNSVKYYGLYIDMPDQYLYASLYFSCFDGNYTTAKKILNKRRQIEERTLPDYLNELCNICDATDELLTELYGNCNCDAAEKIASHWLSQYPDLLYFMRAKMFLSIRKMQEEDVGYLLELCENYLKSYEGDGELLKYKGDLLLKSGKVEQAEEHYRMAINSLRNGYCIRDIKEYFSAKEAVEYDKTADKTH